MKRHVIEAAETLRWFKNKYQDRRCGHMFFDVVETKVVRKRHYWEAPLMGVAPVLPGRQCGGHFFVGEEKRDVYHWRYNRHGIKKEEIRIIAVCLRCGQVWGSKWHEEALTEEERAMLGEIPF